MQGLIWRKFCSGVHSENFLVSTKHLLKLSSGRYHLQIKLKGQAKHGTFGFSH